MTEFTAHVYNINNDTFHFEDYTRASLLDECVLRALRTKFWSAARARGESIEDVLRAILRLGIREDEIAAVKAEWAKWWDTYKERVYQPLKLVPLS